MVGELAAGHVAQVQLDHGHAGGGQRVRRAGHAVAAAAAVAQDDLDVLARVVLDDVVGGQLQAHAHHVVRQALQLGHARGHLLDRESPRVRDLARLQHHVALRHAAAGQHVAGGFFLGRERLALVRAMPDVARDLLALARAAGAVLAAVGQADALADAGRQHRLAGVGLEGAAAGLHGDGVGHGLGYPCAIRVASMS
jgi:hypothetical protein